MEDSEKNKEKLLSILNNRAAADEKVAEKKVEGDSMAKKVINSPTPVKSLNLFFWIAFIAIDIIVAFIIYVYWL